MFFQPSLLGVLAIFSTGTYAIKGAMCVESETCYEKYHRKKSFFQPFFFNFTLKRRGGVLFISLQHFIASALDLMPCLQARGTRDCNKGRNKCCREITISALMLMSVVYSFVDPKALTLVGPTRDNPSCTTPWQPTL